MKSISNAARVLGRKGGIATARRLNPEQRRASALHAINARWIRRDSEIVVLLRDARRTLEAASTALRRRSR